MDNNNQDYQNSQQQQLYNQQQYYQQPQQQPMYYQSQAQYVQQPIYGEQVQQQYYGQVQQPVPQQVIPQQVIPQQVIPQQVVPQQPVPQPVNPQQVEEVVSSNTIEIDPFACSNIDIFESADPPVIQEVIEVEKKTRKKNMAIIAGLAAFMVVFSISFFVIRFSPNNANRKVQNREIDQTLTYIDILENSIQSGDFSKEVSNALKETTEGDVSFLLMDIDSDEQMELVGYVEGIEKKYLLQFEIDEDVYYDRSFEMDAKDSLGYAFSPDENRCYWYAESQGTVALIKTQKTILKKNDFINSYYSVTKTIEEVSIIDKFIHYPFDKDFKIETLKENEINQEVLFTKNSITIDSIRSSYSSVLEEKKKVEEEANKAKELEEQKKEIFDLNGVLLHYGKYKDNGNSYGDLTLNRDGSCQIGEKECTWTKTAYKFSSEEMIGAISIKYDDKELFVSSWSSNCISDNKNYTVTYQG